MRRRFWATTLASLILLALSCSGGGDGDDNGGSTLSVGGSTASGGTSAASGGSGAGSSSSGGSGPGLNLPDASAGSGGTGLVGEECAAVKQEATSTFKPVDIVFVIDNSGSMDGEIMQVQQRINEDFAQIIEDSGLDYRVIMISRYGKVGKSIGQSNNPICIGEPLGASDCSDPENTPLENTERFFHYSADVDSRDSWCILLGAFTAPDEYGDPPRPGWTPLAPNGWSQYLRPNSFKTFVEITDDDVDCRIGDYDFDDENTVEDGETAAAAFDAALLELSPEHFGTADARNYRWHSIVAMVENDPVTEPWGPDEPIRTDRCSPGSSGPGTGYQALSRLTGGLRYPTCENDNFDAVFNAIAQGIVQGAELNCEWEIPDPPPGQTFDKNLVNVRYTPGSGDDPIDIGFVAASDECGTAGGWYYDDPANPTQVLACPATCDTIKQDPSGKIDVLFGCATRPSVPQ